MISVIIPVYNCEFFLEKAINSALDQVEVCEVIVVDDGSTDGSVGVMQKLQEIDSRIKIHYHANRANKGRSATRNLGIQKATANYVAFLDADDYFLENRFENDIVTFQQIPSCDGVYSAIGVFFYREASDSEKNELNLYTVTEKIHPRVLFQTLISGKKGHFSIIGLTLKRSIIKEIGYFNSKLKVAEDTEWMWRLSLKSNLFASVISKPVAMRGVHNGNSFNQKLLYDKYYVEMYKSLISWSSISNIDLSEIDLMLKWLWLLKYKQNNGIVSDIYYWLLLFVHNPRILTSYLSLKYFPVIQKRKKIFSIFYD